MDVFLYLMLFPKKHTWKKKKIHSKLHLEVEQSHLPLLPMPIWLPTIPSHDTCLLLLPWPFGPTLHGCNSSTLGVDVNLPVLLSSLAGRHPNLLSILPSHWVISIY